MGKPENWMCELSLMKESNCDSSRFLMIGDRLNTDIIFGKINNFQTLLVGTGINQLNDVKEIIDKIEEGNLDPELKSQIPDYFISSIGELLTNYN